MYFICSDDCYECFTARPCGAYSLAWVIYMLERPACYTSVTFYVLWRLISGISSEGFLRQFVQLFHVYVVRKSLVRFCSCLLGRMNHRWLIFPNSSLFSQTHLHTLHFT